MAAPETVRDPLHDRMVAFVPSRMDTVRRDGPIGSRSAKRRRHDAIDSATGGHARP